MYQPYLVCDVGTGIMGALGAVVGLFHRSRTGRGQHISTSLTNVATLHQGIYLFAGGRSDARLAEPSGVDARGWSPLQRLYRAADGWLFLGAGPDQKSTVMDALGIQHGVDADDLSHAIESVLPRQTRARWAADLGAKGITVQPVREVDEVANDPVWHERGVLRHGLNGEGRFSPVLGVGSAPWAVPVEVLAHPGPLGVHTTTVRAGNRPAASIE